MEFTRFDRVQRWEEIAVALLKKYIDRYYKYENHDWEKDHLEYHELTEDDPNFVHEYRLLIDQSQDAIVENLGKLKQLIQTKAFKKDWAVRQPARLLLRTAPLPAAVAFQERLGRSEPGYSQ